MFPQYRTRFNSRSLNTYTHTQTHCISAGRPNVTVWYLHEAWRSSRDKLFQIKAKNTSPAPLLGVRMKEDIMQTSQITVHNKFLPFQVNTIPVLGGGRQRNTFWLRAERPLSALVKQFRPPEQRWVFKLPPFISGRVITPGSQSRRYRFQGI